MKLLPFFLLLMTAWCCQSKKDLGKVADFIDAPGIGRSQQVYVAFDNSCNICFQVLIHDLKNSGLNERSFVLISPRKKFHFEEFFLNKYFREDHFYLTDNEQLTTLVTKYTNDIKGPYKLSVSNGSITDISVVKVN